MDKRKTPWLFRKIRKKSGIANAENFHPEGRRIAHLRLDILKAYHEEVSKSHETEDGRLKEEVLAEFIALFNAGMILPEVFGKPEHLSRSTIYDWDKLHRENGFVALIPGYKWKLRPGAAVIPIKSLSRLRKIVIPGSPGRRRKREVPSHISRGWERPPLTCPIRLSIFYSMPIPKNTTMRRRMKMLKQRISHTGKPHLDTLNVFIMDCMAGIVFEDLSQIIGFSCQKEYRWSPQTRIYIWALSG